MYVSNKENPGITAVAGSNIVFLCTFRNIVNSQSVGGAISVDIECQLTLIECLFESCESKAPVRLKPQIMLLLLISTKFVHSNAKIPKDTGHLLIFTRVL